jgi:predicted porin
MKKTLVALAALAATGAFAQSTVTLYGAVDASYNYMSSTGGTAGVDVNASKLATSQLGSSKLGFMGTEDLGGGLKAVFKLEGGLNNDAGAGKATNTNNQGSTTGQIAAGGLAFGRFSYVGLAGSFGELHLGREYVSSFLHGQGVVDPFGTNGPADSTNMFFKTATANSAAVVTNISNMITYETPRMGGFMGGLQLYMGENTQGLPTSTDNGSGYSIYGEYAMGAFFGSAAQSVTKYASTAADGDYTVRALGLSYNFGPAKLIYTYAHEETALLAGITPKNDENLIGVAVPMGAATFKASYIHSAYNAGTAGASDKTGNLLGLGVDYALSKRTLAYVTYANVSNSDNSNLFSTGINNGANGNSSYNFAVGVYHKF